METIVCKHIDAIVEEGLGLQVAQCSLCGQVREFLGSDKSSEVITKLGRIGDKIVMPPVGQPLRITPEESRLVREGWDKLKPPVGQPLRITPEEESRLVRDGWDELKPPVHQRKVRGKYDEHTQEILSDYGQMTIVDLQKKWNMPKGCFYQLKKRWEAAGVDIPIAYADRQTTPADNKVKSVRVPAVGDKRRKTYKDEGSEHDITQKKEAKVKFNLRERHRYYEEHKDEIIADLLSTGRAATRAKWHIPTGGSLNTLIKRWLTPEQKVSIARPRRRARADLHPDINVMPKFPEFKDTWATPVQIKWLELWQQRYEESQRSRTK